MTIRLGRYPHPGQPDDLTMIKQINDKTGQIYGTSGPSTGPTKVHLSADWAASPYRAAGEQTNQHRKRPIR